MTAYQTPARPGLHPVIAQLIQARKDRNLSQGAVAERLQITQGTLARWESGLREVAFNEVVRWASTFGLDLLAAEPTPEDGPLPELTAGGLA